MLLIICDSLFNNESISFLKIKIEGKKQDQL